MKTPKGKDNLIDALQEADLLYFAIVSLFSADTLIDAEACRNSLEALEQLQKEFSTSSLKNKSEIAKLLADAEGIIRRDLEQFEKGVG